MGGEQKISKELIYASAKRLNAKTERRGERARVTGRWDGSGGSILFCTSMKPVIRVSGWTRWIVPRLRGTLVSRWTRCWTTRGQRDFGRHWLSRREDKSFGNSMLRCKVRVFASSIFVLKRDPESREIRMKIKKAHLGDNAREKVFPLGMRCHFSSLSTDPSANERYFDHDASRVAEEEGNCLVIWNENIFDARERAGSKMQTCREHVFDRPSRAIGSDSRTHNYTLAYRKSELEREESGDESTAPSMLNTSQHARTDTRNFVVWFTAGRIPPSSIEESVLIALPSNGG